MSFDGYPFPSENAAPAPSPVCVTCGTAHPGLCPRIKSIEYYPNGSVVRRIEYHDPGQVAVVGEVLVTVNVPAGADTDLISRQVAEAVRNAMAGFGRKDEPPELHGRD